MAATITPITAPQNPDTTGREIIADGTVVLSGSYTVHGDTLNLQQLQDLAKSSQLPTKVEVWEDPPAGTSPTFAQFVFCPGTTQLNGLLAIALIGVELTAETYATAFPGGLPTLRIRAWFPCY
jgi:hypothetical protein